MVKAFEPVFDKLEDLFIDKLPGYIGRINESYNDGCILKDFENQNLFSFSNKLPCFKFSTETADYSDKDRIIENTVFCVGLTLLLPPLGDKGCMIFWRYVEAIKSMVEDVGVCNVWNSIRVSNVIKNVVYLRIVL